MRAPGPRGLAGGALVLLLACTSCAAGIEPPRPSVSPPAPTARPSPSVTPSRSISIPADGVTLRSLGYTFGPVTQFSLPRAAVVTTAVDQANNVTAVLSAPPAEEVATYLRRALPAGGFAVTDDDPATLTLTFAGHGWRGSFTGNETASAVLLRPE